MNSDISNVAPSRCWIVLSIKWNSIFQYIFFFSFSQQFWKEFYSAKTIISFDMYHRYIDSYLKCWNHSVNYSLESFFFLAICFIQKMLHFIRFSSSTSSASLSVSISHSFFISTVRIFVDYFLREYSVFCSLFGRLFFNKALHVRGCIFSINEHPRDIRLACEWVVGNGMIMKNKNWER